MGNFIGQMAPSLQQFYGVQDKGMGEQEEMLSNET